MNKDNNTNTKPVRIKWLGTASLIIDTGDARILLDPYEKKLSPNLPRVDMKEAAGADLCLITHPHLDHFADLQDFFDAGLKQAFVSPRGIQTARKKNVDIDINKLTAIVPGNQIRAGKTNIRVLPSRHCQFDLETIVKILTARRTWEMLGQLDFLRRQNQVFYSGPQDIYAYEIQHQDKNILIFGSLGWDEDFEYPQNPDLLVLAYQGRCDLEKGMEKLLEKIRPKALMITHFDDAFPPLSHTVNLDKFYPAARKYLTRDKIFVPKENEWIVVPD